MPIVYVHGVSIRDDNGWDTIESYLREYIAPKIAKDPQNVLIERCYWGDHGAKFRWSGASAPTSPLRELIPKLRNQRKALPELLGKIEQKIEHIETEILESVPKTIPEAKTKVLHNIRESVKRSAHSAGHVVARAAVEIKSPMNRFVTLFIGDVLTYLADRGDSRAPGWIPACFLSVLADARDNQIERNGEPIIVMSHSMGGQIVYDAVTHFLPRMEEFTDTKIDFWVATASQIGLFEELKLFIESDEEYSIESGIPAPFPDRRHLGYWWNVWDHNDFVSWSVRGIIDGVDDEPYNTGMFVVSAHGGYLEMPSFFRKFAKKVESVLANKELV